jgi:hypothetical protein
MHHWQDIVLALGSIIFSIALLPSLRSEHKPAVSTSLITFGVLVVFALTYASLSLWFSTASITVNAGAWLALALQKRAQKAK